MKKQIVFLVNRQLQNFTQDDIISKIPIDVYNQIKQKDDHPFFTMYSVVHEGVSTPKIIGEGGAKIKWGRSAIQSIKDVVLKGVKFFRGHNKDNSTNNRLELGEVVHSFQEEINGQLHTVAIGYHTQEQKKEVLNYDICSHEAEWDLITAGKNYIAEKIHKFTGIALGNSNHEKPAFEYAKRLGMVQAFSDEIAEKKIKRGLLMDLTTIEFEKLINEVKRRQTFPSQIFTKEDIEKDKNYSSIFDTIKNIENEKSKIEVEKNELEKLLQESEKKLGVIGAKDKLNDVLKTYEIPDNIKKYIGDIFDDSKNSLEDLSEAGLKSFIDSQTKTYQKIAKTINPNIEIEVETSDNKQNNNFSSAKSNTLLKDDFDIENLF